MSSQPSEVSTGPWFLNGFFCSVREQYFFTNFAVLFYLCHALVHRNQIYKTVGSYLLKASSSIKNVNDLASLGQSCPSVTV